VLYGIVCLLCLRSKWVKSHLKIKLNYIYFLKWWQHSYADSNMRLTRHSSDSTAFEAPVNSSQHGVSAAGQLVIRFWAVTSWPCDELTGTQKLERVTVSDLSRRSSVVLDWPITPPAAGGVLGHAHRRRCDGWGRWNIRLRPVNGALDCRQSRRVVSDVAIGYRLCHFLDIWNR